MLQRQKSSTEGIFFTIIAYSGSILKLFTCQHCTRIVLICTKHFPASIQGMLIILGMVV